MTPPFLRPGDTIGICATARWIDLETLEAARRCIEQWGYRVKAGKHLHDRVYQLAGTDDQRRADLQEMLDDPEVNAVLIARGGYGTVRLVDHLDWTLFRQRPKWICGYSDVTVLLNALTNMGVECVHSTMPVSFGVASELALDQLSRALSGDLKQISWSGKPLVEGSARGVVVGGNLSVIMSQLGSHTQVNTRDSILFLEDVDEMLYHTDRMLVALQRAGVLEGIRGLILGGFTLMKDNTLDHGFPADNPWGHDVNDMVLEIAGALGIPVAAGFPAGHMEDNRAFYMGRPAELTCLSQESQLSYL